MMGPLRSSRGSILGAFLAATVGLLGKSGSFQSAAQQVPRDLLHAVIWSMRPAPVRPRQHVARRMTHALRPEDRRSVEDEVVLGAGVDRRGPFLRARAADPRGAGGEDFQAGNVVGRVAVVFPPDEARHAVPLLHAGVL